MLSMIFRTERRTRTLVVSLLPLLLLPGRGLVQGQETRAEEYMMTMDEFNSILMTETPVDFGPPLSSEQSDELWVQATKFQWDYNKVDRSADFSEAFKYAPYIVCSSLPGLSGNERFDALYALLEEAAVDLDSAIFEGDSVYNDDDRTCRLLSAEPGLFPTVISNEPELTDYLQVQPYYTSMKMIEGVFDDIKRSMAEHDCTGECADTSGPITVVSAGGARRRLAEVVVTGQTMELVISLSPIVLNVARTGEATYEDIIQSMLTFVKGNGGMNVAEASFYVNATSEYDAVPDRMVFYSDVVANVTAMTDETTGANVCLDSVLTKDVKIERISGNETIGVNVETIGDDLTEQELEDCLWYLIHALMVNPYVASMDTKPIVVPLPGAPTPVPVPEAPSGATSVVFTAGLTVAAVAASVSLMLESML